MKNSEWQTLQELLETWVKRRRHLGEYNADSADMMILGQALLAVIKGVKEENQFNLERQDK